MKKFISVMLSSLLVIGALSGCSAKNKTTPESSAGETKTEDSAQAEGNAAMIDYPTQNLTLCVPYAAGGGSDTGVRLLAKYVQEDFSKPVIVTNLTGGSGGVAIQDMLKDEPNGYKLTYYTSGHTMLTLEENPKFTFDDLIFVARQVSDPRVIVFKKGDSRFSTSEEFLKYVEEHPGEIKVGVGGLNSSPHYMALLFNNTGGYDTVIVNFADGIASAKSALLGGHIDAISISLGEAMPMANEEQIVYVGVASEDRVKGFEDVPTFKEQGHDIIYSTQRGFVLKAGTDTQIVDMWEKAIKRASENPEYIKEAENLGVQIDFLGKDDYDKAVIQEKETSQEILKLIEN